MTTSVIVHPAGHHVRVTTLEHHDGGTQPTAYELEPGQAPRTFYVHSTMDLKVEEYDPAAEAASRAADAAEHGDAVQPSDIAPAG